MNLLKRLLRYLTGYKGLIFLVVVANLLYAVFSIFTLSMVIPFLSVLFDQVTPVTTRPAFSLTSRFFIDTFYYHMGQVVTVYGPHSALIFIAVVMIVLSLLSNLCRYLSFYWLAPIRAGILHDLRNDLYSRILILPLSFYSRYKKGDILSRMGPDVLEVEWSLFSSLQSLCRDPFLIIVFVVTLFSISAKLTLIALVLLPAIGYLLGFIGKKIAASSLRMQQLLGNISALFEEAVGGLRVIQGYNAEPYAEEKFGKQNNRFYQLHKRIFRINELGSPLVEFLCIVAILLITLIALWLIPSLMLRTSALFLLYFVVFARLIVPAKALVSTYYTMQKGLTAAQRVYEVIDAEEEIVECENPLPLTELQQEIRFQDVSFAYHPVENEDQCDVLRHVNLTIPKGKTVAIVGPSGGGKSTMMDLLSRFYDLTYGEILIDGIPNHRYIIRDLRALFGVVSQDVILFNDTVYQNIVMGMPDVTEEQVVEAAKMAQAHNFILELEEGYKTILGDRGMRLSGGQRQRISIARTLLRNPQVLVLDEATSALDNESEYLFQEALTPLLKDRTAIIIAHRLSTIRLADTICFLQNGTIAEQGSHEELMALKGLYYNFYTSQKGED
jgi:ABC-type multidrug transport system fused ATPase/permease subunit